MATLTIRNVDPDLHGFLRRQAARHGRSMEAEVRAVLAETMRAETESAGAVARRIRARFAGLEPEEALTQPARPPAGDPPGFGA